MRSAAPLVAIALLVGGCASSAPTAERGDKSGYNRRELRPDTPGLLTGPSGVWTIYSSRAPRAARAADPGRDGCAASDRAAEAAPGAGCPAPEKPPRTVLLPKP